MWQKLQCWTLPTNFSTRFFHTGHAHRHHWLLLGFIFSHTFQMYRIKFGVVMKQFKVNIPILLLLLQRSTAVQVRSSARLMPQNQQSGRGLLPSPTAWLPDQYYMAILADVSRHISGRTEGQGLGFGQLVCICTWKSLKCQCPSDGLSDYSALCAGGR